MKKVFVNTKPDLTNIKDVNRIVFHIFFPMKYSKENIINKILLKRMLLTGSKIYNTPEKYGKAYESNFIMGYNVKTSTDYEGELIHFTLTVPKEGLIDGASLDNQLNFFHEMIFNPNVEDGRFDVQQFNYEKDYLLQRETEFPRNINEFAYEEYNRFIDPNEEDDISHDTYMKLLNEVTPESVYEYYDKAIKNNNFFTFIGGAIGDNTSVIDTFNKYFKQEEKELEMNFEFFNIHKVNEYEERVFKKDYNQSMLFLHYNFKDYTQEEYLKLSLLDYFLNSRENNLLFHKLRIDNNMMYTFDTRAIKVNGFYDIILYLNKEDMDESKKLINEVFDSIRDEKTFNECKERTLKAMGYDLLSVEDDPFYSLSVKLSDLLDYDYELEEKIEKIREITYSDMMDFLDRMIHTKTMIIESGDNHE